MTQFSERATRKKLIDRTLTDAGWRVVPFARWQAGDRSPADACQASHQLIDQNSAN